MKVKSQYKKKKRYKNKINVKNKNQWGVDGGEMKENTQNMGRLVFVFLFFSSALIVNKSSEKWTH